MTPEVDALRDKFELPGMKVLQFAFGGDSGNAYLPHNYTPNCAVYTSTHDSDTARGWFEQSASEEARTHLLRYLGCANREEIHWEMIRLAWSSVADMALAQTQDVLGLDNSGRMNLPGSLGGNWSWRMPPGALTPEMASRLADLTELYGRIPGRKIHY
jgi:4-alpha-glucanotransferase